MGPLAVLYTEVTIFINWHRPQHLRKLHTCSGLVISQIKKNYPNCMRNSWRNVLFPIQSCRLSAPSQLRQSRWMPCARQYRLGEESLFLALLQLNRLLQQPRVSHCFSPPSIVCVMVASRWPLAPNWVMQLTTCIS